MTNQKKNKSSVAQDTGEVGADHGRLKGRRGLLAFLEHNGDDVVSNVTLPFHLLFVLFGVRQHGGNMKHDLMALVYGINGMNPRGVIFGVQTATVARPALERDCVTQEI